MVLKTQCLGVGRVPRRRTGEYMRKKMTGGWKEVPKTQCWRGGSSMEEERGQGPGKKMVGDRSC